MSKPLYEDGSETLIIQPSGSSEPDVAIASDAAGPGIRTDPHRLPRPEATNPQRIVWPYLIVVVTVHLVSLLAFIPWLFTWSGLILAVLGHFIFGMLGITVGYHRLLTHRGFTCPRWFERTLTTLGLCNLQDSPARWVAIHRMHHRFSDQQADPHSPLVSFLWGHIGWVVYQHKVLDHTVLYAPYVPDILRDPYYRRLEQKNGWFFVYIAHAIVIIAVGALVGFLTGGPVEALRYAASWAVWAVSIRTVFVLHGTWTVNSLTHLFGYRNYETRDQSTNNWFVALISHGEGWHNNHHAEPRAASHGHRWWEFDMSWWVIRTLEAVGLAKNVVRPELWSSANEE